MSASDLPSLSVLLPVHNGERFLADAISSVLAQSFSDFELIIVDDGSQDRSAEIAQSFAARDARVRVMRQRNRGLVETLNYGITLARAPLIARMDADDICLADRFLAQVPHFATKHDLAVLGGFIIIMDEQGHDIRIGRYPVARNEIRAYLDRGSPFAHPTVVLRKEAVVSVGGYRKLMRHAEDYDLWLRLADAGFALENVPRPVLRYRQHSESVSMRHREEQVLATVVARLAHRARLAGLHDPTFQMNCINSGSIEAFPQHLRGDLEAELFVIRHPRASISSLTELDAACASMAALPREIRAQPAMAHFALRAAAGYLRHRKWIPCATMTLRAVWLDARGVLAAIGHRLVARFPFSLT